MKTLKDSKIYSYERDSYNFGIHILYYVLVILIRTLFINRSNSMFSIFLFVSCYIVLLFSSSLNSPRILPAKEKGKLLYNIRLITKVASYFIITHIITTSLLVIYMVIVAIIEITIIYIFIRKKDQLFYYFEDKDIVIKFLRKNKNHK